MFLADRHTGGHERIDVRALALRGCADIKRVADSMNVQSRSDIRKGIVAPSLRFIVELLHNRPRCVGSVVACKLRWRLRSPIRYAVPDARPSFVFAAIARVEASPAAPLEPRRLCAACELRREEHANWSAIPLKSTFMTESAEHLLDWLRDAHAMEQQAEQMLRAQSGRLEHYPELKTRIDQHLEETLGRSAGPARDARDSAQCVFRAELSKRTAPIGHANLSMPLTK